MVQEDEPNAGQLAVPVLQKLFAAMPSACLALDAHLTIVAATDEFLRMTRTTRRSLIGRKLLDVFPEEAASNDASSPPPSVQASIENVLACGAGNVLPVQRLLVARPDAAGGGYSERHYRRSNHPVLAATGEVLYVIHQIEDVTPQAELEQARAAADSASAAKSQFLSSMSHELRTPLNAILGFAQLLAGDRREPLSRRHGERVAQILRGGEHLVRLVDDILDLSRIEGNGVAVSIHALDVLEVLGDVVDMLAPIAQAAGVRLEMMPRAVGVPLVSADRTRYTQVLANLGSNAIKYNRPGGSVAFGVSWQEDDGVVCVRVADTGLGIPTDKQGLLFRPFERAGRELGPIDGSGIGLALTKRLAELMGGGVGFTSVEGEGSEFWVRIPVYDCRRRTSVPPPRSEDAPPLLVARRQG